MCMNCGCGEPDERHKDGDITYADLQRAASNSDIDPEKAADNIHAAARKIRDEGGSQR
ncbi:MAG: hypothetical protein JF887_10700 [Candidatus Dormibacteraeota bacterium]|uniref:Uncharacterized protein n=1 Tax=Candidatus Amunia macphersoniae TaxID=3127014 RepID=A0A934NJR1_9BACT|nr:hypothetical protein [Candidatus Dormibacteraeota bacterium]